MKDNTYLTIQSWMRTDLNLSGNELLVYAIIYGFSQDGESRFTGSRQYLADWCGCTVRSIQTVLNDLTERGLLTKYESVKNNVKLCEYVANFTTSEKISPPSEKISPNNIDNTIVDNITINSNIINNNTEEDAHCYSAEELKNDFLGSMPKRPGRARNLYEKKKNLFEQCEDEILKYTKNIVLQDELRKYLTVRLAHKDKPLYGVNQWIGMLNKLSEVSGESAFDKSISKRLEIVKQSMERGWCSFFDVKTQPQYTRRSGSGGEFGEVKCNKSEEENIIDEKF